MLSHGWCDGMVGPLASLAGCQSRGHDVTALAWLVHCNGIAGPLAARGHDSHATLAWLIRWHCWQAARGHDVTGTALAWLVRWHRWQLGWKIRS